MAEPRLAAVLDRLERATARLEARPAPDPRLPERNAALRAAMAEAVEGIDRLLAAEAE